MHFSVMYRLRWYRRAFTCYGASNKCAVGKIRYFRAKCVNITRLMVLVAAALLQTSCYLVCNLFSRRIGAIFGMLSRRTCLSASAGLSCISCQGALNFSELTLWWLSVAVWHNAVFIVGAQTVNSLKCAVALLAHMIITCQFWDSLS